MSRPNRSETKISRFERMKLNRVDCLNRLVTKEQHRVYKEGTEWPLLGSYRAKEFKGMIAATIDAINKEINEDERADLNVDLAWWVGRMEQLMGGKSW